MRINYNDAVEAIAKYTACFSSNVSNATKEQWVNFLMVLAPERSILSRAIQRCADNDLGSSWSRLRAAIDLEARLHRERGDFRQEGVVRRREPQEEVPPEITRARFQVINRILSGRIKYPKEFGEHNEAAAARWFNTQVESILMEGQR